MLEVYLIRHGESVGNEENRWQGTADYPLSARGICQAAAAGRCLAGRAIDRLYTSQLGRARQTAEVIGAAIGRDPIVDARWQEYDIGVLAGLRPDEIREAYPGVYEAMMRPGAHYVPMPGEEGAWPFRHRVTAVWQDLIAAHPAGRVAVVTHRAVMMSLICHLVGLPPERRGPFRFYNGSISLIQWDGQRATIRCLNDTCHLGEAGGPIIRSA